MKKGFIEIEAVLSLLIVFVLVFIMLSFYKVLIKYKDKEKEILEEIRWERLENLSYLNSCLLEEDQ